MRAPIETLKASFAPERRKYTLFILGLVLLLVCFALLGVTSTFQRRAEAHNRAQEAAERHKQEVRNRAKEDISAVDSDEEGMHPDSSADEMADSSADSARSSHVDGSRGASASGGSAPDTASGTTPSGGGDSASASGASSAPPPAPATITVSVTVDGSRAAGYSATMVSQSVTIRQGASVYDALAATGIAVGWSSGYVRAIGGLAEFQFGAGSGWVYFVNGSRPGIGAGSYILHGGESIRWVYTLDFGNDL
ncbi:MAG: DUF4430 domain-containing protein [Coriobacteriia bacterium]|nr:DUF4430 domain-containing protein [Coriobacteriia bacterium]